MFGSIDLRLRPIRLAFLVDPRNARSVREAIQINSTLWGGSRNPIIPVYKRTPEIWADRPLSPPKAETIIKGYISAFDPDVLVQCTSDLPSCLEKTELRVIKPEEIWKQQHGDGTNVVPRFGMGLFELLDEIFEAHFRYKERFPIEVVIPELPQQYGLFWASVFGDIPTAIRTIVARDYTKALNIQTPVVTLSQLKPLLNRGNLFPRRITFYGLDSFRRSSFGRDECVFFMDANESGDVIDYWNLRALGKQVVPVPKHLKDDDFLRDIVSEFLRSVRRPYRDNPSIYRYASVVKARHATHEEMLVFARSLQVKKEGDDAPTEPYFVLQNWYPESGMKRAENETRRTMCLASNGVWTSMMRNEQFSSRRSLRVSCASMSATVIQDARTK